MVRLLHQSVSISPGGSPKKGVNKANKEIFPIFSLKFRVLKLRFLAFSEGPGGFKELRKARRNHFHLSWYLIVPGITSYDQKPSTKNLVWTETVQRRLRLMEEISQVEIANKGNVNAS